MKKYLFILPLVLLAAVFTAFKGNNPESNSRSGEVWFTFTGQPGEENIPSKYVYLVSQTPECDMIDENLCEIKAERQAAPNQHLPNLSTVVSQTFKP